MKTPFWKDAASHYIQRIGRMRRIDCREVRDGNPSLPTDRRKAEEGRRLLECPEPGDALLVLDEGGTPLTSQGLADLLRGIDASSPGPPAFVVGGPYGLDPSVLARASRIISLSSMTLPHELARVVLLEQLYRALCILGNIPYHH